METKIKFSVELTGVFHTFTLYSEKGKEIFDIEEAVEEAERMYPGEWQSVFNGQESTTREDRVTPVIFRKTNVELTALVEARPMIVAVFPCDIATMDGKVNFYTREYQHSHEYVRTLLHMSKPVSELEYHSIKKELEQRGYILKVFKRDLRKFQTIRINKVKELNKR